VSAPSVPVHRPSIDGEQIPANEGLSLTALLDLIGAERAAAVTAPAPAPAHPPIAEQRPGLRECIQDWVRRAADWGAGPQGSWRAW
jgi:hypothetical protein